jgi:hypothetical protein
VRHALRLSAVEQSPEFGEIRKRPELVLVATQLGLALEYVARLLVNAFLEDLRRAYLLRPWHLLRRRRMTYPMLLLDNIAVDNGGYLLLRLVNDVRNQVGVFDPLLVVAHQR